ncbi:PQQ-dependent sugar dehydrogenase [Nocardioides sp.]|uniref:PQQ-dependent sugar dehydrogenase n=1 Tax=Nocardioides sp. TaxID=35761 RepID=UPI0039E5F0C4
MEMSRRVLLLAAPLAVVGCDSQTGPGSDRTGSTRSPVPSPNNAGSTTPSASRSAPDPQEAATLAEGVSVPWGIAFLPDGSALVGERDTFRVLRVADSGVEEVGEVPGVVSQVSSSGEGGLLGFALHPTGSWLYAYVSTAADNRVVRMSWDGSSLGEPAVILDGIETSIHHNGGGLLFGPDGLLYVSTGDAEDSALAPDTSSLNGKILRITDTGEVPPGNPFDNPVWSYGHRNVEGMALDAKGRLWASEFGDKGYDELNRIVAGADYGWPAGEGSGFGRSPLAQWPTSDCSPSGIAITRGRAWLGALQGECVWSVSLSSGRARRHLEGHGRIRLVALAPDGALWVGTSNRDGRVVPADGDDRLIRVTL